MAGRNVYHIVAKQKGDQVCIGKPEYWIDQENWMVLKTFAQNYHKDQQITLQYTKVDFECGYFGGSIWHSISRKVQGSITS